MTATAINNTNMANPLISITRLLDECLSRDADLGNWRARREHESASIGDPWFLRRPN
jgi:hypothetical protein